MGCDSPHFSVKDLIERGDLLVSDGYRAKSDQFLPNGIPFGRIPNVVGGFSFNGADLLPRHIVEPIKISKQGDVVFTSKGTVGRFALVRKDTPEFVYSPQLCFWRSLNKEIIDPNWLYYWMHSKEFFVQYKSVAGQTDMAEYVSLKDQRRMGITLPAISEQTRVAGILGAFDEKIELNRKMNETLEQMARALFKSWFVDFDPVHAKAAGLEPTGIDKATADLFPDSFMVSELGKIPKGWTSAPVGETVDCQGGATPSTSEAKYWEGGTHHWTTPKDFSSLESPFLLDTDRKLTDAGISKISSGLLPAGTLLLSSRAPIGYIAIATLPVAINQGFIALKCNETASNFFMLNWCKSNMAEIESRATGTTFPEISKLNFRPILVCLPPKEVMTAFTGRVTPLYAQVVLNLRQSRSLSAIRDALLPGLLSGNISTSPKL